MLNSSLPVSRKSIFGSLQLDAPRSKSRPPRQISRNPTERSTFFGKDIQLACLTAASEHKRSSFLPIELCETGDNVSKKSTCMFESIAYQKLEQPKRKNVTKKFCTGSRYFGDYNQLGMCGKGIYKYPHGVIYDGYFNRKGEFHGTGTLIYPGGQKIEGIWRNGKLAEGSTCVTKSNHPMERQYCRMPDRRFQIEVDNEIRPAGQEYLTNAETPRRIPSGMYDAGTGFFDPKSSLIVDYENPQKSTHIKETHDEEKEVIYKLLLEKTISEEALMTRLRRRVLSKIAVIESVPADEYSKWIKLNCRKAWDEPIGYRRELYEAWTAGYRNEDLDWDTVCDFEEEDRISRFSQLSESQQPITQKRRRASLSRYSKMYSFINRHRSSLLRKLEESRRNSSGSELSVVTVDVAPSRRPVVHKKKKRIQGRASSLVVNYKSRLKYFNRAKNVRRKFPKKVVISSQLM